MLLYVVQHARVQWDLLLLSGESASLTSPEEAKTHDSTQMMIAYRKASSLI